MTFAMDWLALSAFECKSLYQLFWKDNFVVVNCSTRIFFLYLCLKLQTVCLLGMVRYCLPWDTCGFTSMLCSQSVSQTNVPYFLSFNSCSQTSTSSTVMIISLHPLAECLFVFWEYFKEYLYYYFFHSMFVFMSSAIYRQRTVFTLLKS